MMKERLPTLKFLPNRKFEMDAKMFTIETAVMSIQILLFL